MARKTFLLDTSALFTLIEGEDGMARVQEVVRQEDTLIPWLALLEVNYITRQEVGPEEAERRYALLTQLPGRILWEVDEGLLLSAAKLKADFRISLADALIAAQARQASAVLLHKDPEYEVLAGFIELEALPYKGT